MRGLLVRCLMENHTARYNPAYAGTTAFTMKVEKNIAIQPRVCGDYTIKTRTITVDLDTTPRMRGLQFSRETKAKAVRYNPAYAGTTGGVIMAIYHVKIQPRVCGDYTSQYRGGIPYIDTTPRMRGLPVSLRLFGSCCRYNPAYAGTTLVLECAYRRIAIQPRVCGDYCAGLFAFFGGADTTPRMRGLQIHHGAR